MGRVTFRRLLLTLCLFYQGCSPLEQPSGQESCRYLSLKCSFRGGCGATLRSYLLECNDLIKNKTEVCSESCKYTLIGLTSTHEGKSMLDCDCGSDEDCLNSRLRLETCSKDSVLYANRRDTVVSCTEAKWICMSDSECSKALEYYNIFCKSMFRGSKCTPRCVNSIRILKKQNKAAKLESCLCDSDDVHGYKCSDIKQNMRDLCGMDEATTEKMPEQTEAVEDPSILWTTTTSTTTWVDIIENNEIPDLLPPSRDERNNNTSTSGGLQNAQAFLSMYTVSVIACLYRNLIGL